MGVIALCQLGADSGMRRVDQAVVVLGVTDSQICVMLRARARALRRAGWRVVLICSPGELLDQIATEEGVERLAIPMRREIAPFSDLVSLYRLWTALRTLQPDVTEFSTPKAGLLGCIAALLCRVPVRIYMLRGLRLDTATGLKRTILKAAERIAAVCSHVVLCNSVSLRQRALALRLAGGAKLRTIARGSSNGVDAGRFSPGPDNVRARLGIPASASVIGFVGRLTRDKGVPELMDAFDHVLEMTPDAYLLLVGRFDDSADALSPELCSSIKSHPRIVHTGFVQDTAPYYRAMDLLILPTWREGFPNVALEAAATEIPVISTRVTGARDAVLDGRTGVLIDPGDPVAIANAILNLLRDPQTRAAMGSAARRWVIQQFDQRRVLGLTLRLYRDMLHNTTVQGAPVAITDWAAPAD